MMFILRQIDDASFNQGAHAHVAPQTTTVQIAPLAHKVPQEPHHATQPCPHTRDDDELALDGAFDAELERRIMPRVLCGDG